MKRTTAIGVFLAACLSASGAFAGMIYWTEYYHPRRIWRANLNGTNATELITSLEHPRGIALDLVHNKIYWADSSTRVIQRANLDGSDIEVVVNDLHEPAGVAVDANAGKVYWTNSSFYTLDIVQRANLDGTDVEVLVTGLDPYHFSAGITLDLGTGTMYWIESGTIWRADLDGANAEIVLAPGADSWFWCIDYVALDLANGRLYWVDLFISKIGRARLDGSEPELVTWEVDWPSGGIALDVFADRVYWAEYSNIRYMNLDGPYPEELFSIPIPSPQAIALDLRTTDGDCTGDGLTDLEDYSCFMVSFAGPAKSISAGLECGDVNSDGHIDLADFGIFQNQFD